ncbi:MAG: uroporphyrinogen-III C-methyltransferase [Candidatus Riflebacteria bacterium]|nr:uroporphyrinogen-III C-methyltransferase [Candidatus Riflebacteria bacterium]
MHKPNVFLVGAGPGDTGLITVRGLELVKSADVLVYDQLGVKGFLGQVKPGCEMYDVGKFAGNHKVTQDDINKLLVTKACENEGKNLVVRLKGGDPFVFGRGGEEALFMRENGIDFEIVPGVTSAISAAAYAGIPITQRGYTASLAIVTGHEAAKDSSDIDWASLSGIGTIVFLMGVKNLSLICENLIKAGKSADTPMALVQSGTMPNQRTVTGTLATMPEIALKHDIQPPAISIVGDVVRLRDKLKWFENRPLFGKKIVVTRSRTQASSLVKELSELGAEVIECPTISIVQHEDSQEFLSFISEHKKYGYIIFTSVNGVTGFFEQATRCGFDSRIFADKKVICIGPATAEALRNIGIIADFVPESYVAESIIPYFENSLKADIAILRAEKAREILPESLRKLGHNVKIVSIYRTELIRPEPTEDMSDLLRNGQIDFVTFTSSSTVEGFSEMIKGHNIENDKVPAAVIGPITEATCNKYGYNIKCRAAEYTIKGLIDAITKEF